MDGQRDNGEHAITDGCASARMRTNLLTSPPSLAPASEPGVLPTEERLSQQATGKAGRGTPSSRAGGGSASSAAAQPSPASPLGLHAVLSPKIITPSPRNIPRLLLQQKKLQSTQMTLVSSKQHSTLWFHPVRGENQRERWATEGQDTARLQQPPCWAGFPASPQPPELEKREGKINQRHAKTNTLFSTCILQPIPLDVPRWLHNS